ncbi:MAG: ABC transporter ATP-binding protein [Verrucomicrobiaceae bacterium]|nr:ABC transporter ATP-binding protein [Verrucomicrobiaceae bacterium]
MISVENLHRSFGDLKAVDGVSFTIDSGRVVGFVGANGAGKTTTMRIMATLDHPSSGRVVLGGHNVVHHPAKARRILGWMPDSFGTYEHMTVLEYLDFYARALGYRGKERLARVQEVMDFTDLTPLADRMSNKMSKGQTQRLCLGRALLHDPQVLIMDEPAAGLDPKARIELKNLIRILSQEGRTILISSHILSELGEMCDSLLFIDKGRIVHHGDADTLKRSGQNEQTTIVNVEVAGDPRALQNWALTAAHVKILDETKRGARLCIDSADEQIVAGVLRRLVTDQILVLDFHREERRLEDAFVDILADLNKPKPPPVPVVLPPPPPAV